VVLHVGQDSPLDENAASGSGTHQQGDSTRPLCNLDYGVPPRTALRYPSELRAIAGDDLRLPGSVSWFAETSTASESARHYEPVLPARGESSEGSDESQLELARTSSPAGIDVLRACSEVVFPVSRHDSEATPQSMPVDGELYQLHGLLGEVQSVIGGDAVSATSSAPKPGPGVGSVDNPATESPSLPASQGLECAQTASAEPLGASIADTPEDATLLANRAPSTPKPRSAKDILGVTPSDPMYRQHHDMEAPIAVQDRSFSSRLESAIKRDEARRRFDRAENGRAVQLRLESADISLACLSEAA